MTFQMTLPQELKDRLDQEAVRRREPTEAVALRVLDQNLPPALDARRVAALATLERMMKEVAMLSDDELAANAATLRALDEDRPSYRKLYSDLLAGDSK